MTSKAPTVQQAIPQAREFMHRNVHTVTPEMTLAQVVEFLQKHEISNAPVVEAEEPTRLVGFISEHDCLEFLVNELFYGNPCPPQTARTIMKRHPLCVNPDTDGYTLASIFCNHGYRHLPVVDGAQLLGIVSRRDVLKAMSEYCHRVDKQSEAARFRPDIHELMYHRFILKGQR